MSEKEEKNMTTNIGIVLEIYGTLKPTECRPRVP